MFANVMVGWLIDGPYSPFPHFPFHKGHTTTPSTGGGSAEGGTRLVRHDDARLLRARAATRALADGGTVLRFFV